MPLTRKQKNLLSLIGGIILMLIGMGGTSISLASVGFQGIVIAPFVLFLIGVFFTYMGADEKW